MPTLGDLIEVPPIRVVIQLADLADDRLREEILDSFVFTEEVNAFFRRLLGALEQPTGLGCFLKGHYGSGKSHALAFLARLMSGDDLAARALPDDLPRGGLNRPWHICSVPLLAYPGHASLESILLEEIERTLRLAGHPVALAQRSRLLENFRTLILPHHPQLEASFSNLDEEEAYHRAMSWLRELPDNPLSLTYDRRSVMAQLSAALEEHGLLLLLDELSEFLKSKPDDRAFNEDIRFLQFLGEWSDKLPLWVVATLQESLEELGYREQAGYQRIKERYPLSFTLSARHVADLVQGRLIRLRPGAEVEVDRLWAQLDRAFPGLVNKADFRRFYPLHPATLSLLESLMPLFSRHRGVVDFVFSQLAGDPRKGLPGLLGESADRLLTPDAIYDHFRERIRETPESNAYDRIAFTYLSKEIPQLLESERDQELALRLVKVLILFELSPAPHERTAANLARMTSQRISMVNPRANTRHVEANILQPLCRKSSYIVESDDRYSISLQADSHQVVAQRLRELTRSLRPNWRAALRLVQRKSLPLADLMMAASAPLRLKWENTPRQGCLLVGMVVEYPELMSMLARLEEQREDFALILGLPEEALLSAHIKNARGSAMGEALVLWAPAPPSPELREHVLELQARELLAQEMEREGDDQAHLVRAGRGELERKVSDGLAELYLQGRVLTCEGERDAPHTDLGWEARLALLVGPCLATVFPKHAQVAPSSDCLTSHHLKQLWQFFLQPGSCGEVTPVLVRELMMPLGMAVAIPEGYRLEADPARTPVLAEIVDRLAPGQKIPTRELARALQKGSYGVHPAIFAVLVAGLVQSGRATVYANERATSIDSLESLTTFRLDALGLAKQLDAGIGKRLASVEWLWPPEQVMPFTPARQNELWEKALPELTSLHRQVVACRRWQGSAAELTSAAQLPLDELRHHLAAVEEMCLQVGTPKGAVSGLRKLAQSKASELTESVAWVNGWAAFGERGLREFQQTMARLRENGESASLDLATPNPEPVWEAFRARYLEREKERAERYLASHEQYYRHPTFLERARLEGLPQWRALQALSGLVGLEIEPRPTLLRERLSTLPRPCKRNVPEQLLLTGHCACGLPADPGEPPPAPDLQGEIEGALRSGLRSLLAQEEKIVSHLRELRQVGQSVRAERLEELLAAAGEGVSQRQGEGFWRTVSSRLLACLDSTTVSLAGRALTGRAMVVRRDPERLLSELKGATVPPDRLRRIFETWLTGDGLPSDAWVEVGGGGGGAPAWLAAWLAQHDLEPTPAMRRRYRLEDTGPAEGQAVDVEAELLPLIEPLIATLPLQGALSRERLLPSVSKELCRRALRGRHQLSDTEIPFEHGKVFQAASQAWRELEREQGVSQAAALASKALFLDRAHHLLTPDLEAELRLAVEQGWQRCPDPGLELAAAPSTLEELEGPLVVVLVDALRWDLYLRWRSSLVEALGEPWLEQRVAAALPTVTRKARAMLLGGEGEAPAGYDGILAGRPVTMIRDAERKPAECEALLKTRFEAAWLHVSFVDRRAHASDLELWPLFRELDLQAQTRLFPLLGRVANAGHLLLASDHGFLSAEERPHGRPHGGATPQERWVPWVVWRRRG